ncbi:hypothetical protein [Sphaerisporangium corydalis]|uniref:hypothetical protein n=1 Tax=Sphaerisporangium corydalis TaxID=1441875 RepID=UPI0021D2D21D|nr:hypothetical protein [Sphaerisporangium corydalis]
MPRSTDEKPARRPYDDAAAGRAVAVVGGLRREAFGGYGCALAVAAVSYQLRSRPVCAPLGASDEEGPVRR